VRRAAAATAAAGTLRPPSQSPPARAPATTWAKAPPPRPTCRGTPPPPSAANDGSNPKPLTLNPKTCPQARPTTDQTLNPKSCPQARRTTDQTQHGAAGCPASHERRSLHTHASRFRPSSSGTRNRCGRPANETLAPSNAGHPRERLPLSNQGIHERKPRSARSADVNIELKGMQGRLGSRQGLGGAM
jgi:hypothetical protein